MTFLQRILNKPRAIEPIALLRIFFGFLILAESWGAIATGWVTRILVEPQFTFNFIGLDFLQFFVGPQAYAYFYLMGVFGLMTMLGWYYRVGIIGFALMWTVVYLTQKSAYNNHYYLLVLLSWVMACIPAHRCFSLDVKHGRVNRNSHVPQWTYWIFIGQLWIVYTYASLNKLQSDWLDGKPIEIWFSRFEQSLLAPFITHEGFKYFISYSGILFDLFIIPALLYKHTRKWAFALSVGFHLFNSVVFQIGIFPYLMLSFCVLFFSPDISERILRFMGYKKWNNLLETTKTPRWVGYLFIVYLVIQVLLPLRHHNYDSDVNWSEEGHRMSWRMMLRTKSGHIKFVAQLPDGTKKQINNKDYLTDKQVRSMRSRPDMIWQTAQQMKKDFPEGTKIFCSSFVTLNGKDEKRFIDPKVDLTAIEWERFTKSDWILAEDHVNRIKPVEE